MEIDNVFANAVDYAITAVKVEPGDVIVVKLHINYSLKDYELERLEARLKETFPPYAKFLIYSAQDCEIGIVHVKESNDGTN